MILTIDYKPVDKFMLSTCLTINNILCVWFVEDSILVPVHQFTILNVRLDIKFTSSRLLEIACVCM